MPTIIRNYSDLATSPSRNIVLNAIEEGLSAIQPHNVMENEFSYSDGLMKVKYETFDMGKFDDVYIMGFGKGAAGISKIIEQKMGDRIRGGYVIDVVPQDLERSEFTLGTHPLPSEQNYEFTKNATEKLGSLNERDMVIMPVCGGGSAMLVYPDKISLEKLRDVNKELLRSGTDIYETNTVRKHLSKVKGGGLAKMLYPATVVGMVFSDVPGNDESSIASGPAVMDKTTVDEAWSIVKKYGIDSKTGLSKDDMVETPKDPAYFRKAPNVMVLSNMDALKAMKNYILKKTEYDATIYTDRFQGEAREAGKRLIEAAKDGTVLLAGGETTVNVKGSGKGGRNQEVALGAMKYMKDLDMANDDSTVLASVGSDGWDFEKYAGAIVDMSSVKRAHGRRLDIDDYLDNNDSMSMFDQIGDGIDTGKLPSNVSDLYVVMKGRML